MSTTTHRRPRPRLGKRQNPEATSATAATQTTTTATAPTPEAEAETPPTRPKPRLSKPTRPSKTSKPSRLNKPAAPSKPNKPNRLNKPTRASKTAAPTTTPTTPAKYKVTTLGVLRSEWTKFWSLRSSWITLGVAVALLIVFGAIAAYTYSPDAVATTGPGGDTGDSDAVSLALTGVTFGALAIGVLGVLLSAGEYTTGMVRSTFAAVPRRLPVLFSKAAVIGPIALILSTLGALAAFQLGTPGLDGEKIALSLSDDGVLRSLAGAGLYLGLVAVFGVALGVLLRSSAGAIAALVGVLLVLPGLGSLLPDSWYDTLSPYFPSNAGSAVYSLHQASDSLSPGAGLAVFAGWVALTLAGAAYRLAKTDA